MEEKKEYGIVRSSAAEYLTFISAAGAADAGIEVRHENGDVWLTQKLMAQLYGVDVADIAYHVRKVYDEDKELPRETTIKNFLIVRTEGSRTVRREVSHYNLRAIIAVGFKVNSERAVQFRKWASLFVRDYPVQGWAIDDERLKSGGTILNTDYFEKLLERIREIRLSERRFYQKLTDIYATSLDYDPASKATKRFFAAVQKRLHHAISGHTAAELIASRADAQKEHMGLTSWEGSPGGKIHKYDVSIVKNYLSAEELGQLERLVSAYLDLAELQARRQVPMTMADWEERLTGFLALVSSAALKDAGKVSAEMAKAHAEAEFEKYRIRQDRAYESDFDRFLALEKRLPQSDAS